MKIFLIAFVTLINFAWASFDGSWKFIDATSDIYIDIEDNEQTFSIERIYIWHPFIAFEHNQKIVLQKQGSDLLYNDIVIGEYDSTFFDIAVQTETINLMLFGARRELNQLYVYSVFDIFEIDGTFELVK